MRICILCEDSKVDLARQNSKAINDNKANLRGIGEKRLLAVSRFIQDRLREDGSQLITDTDGNFTALDAPSDIASGDFGKGFSELAAAVEDTANAASDALKATGQVIALGVGIATSATVGLLVPVSEAQVLEANKVIKNYTGSVPDGLQTPANLSQKKQNPV